MASHNAESGRASGDLCGGACATAGRAGHRRVVIGITLLGPEHPALRRISA
ncbi:hypothetical protein ACFXPM_23670 [Streptomyces sp. NPDC059095]|uniref:hypothetical protein n=1 Tax=Streptomyces sp. NPDC059095 TaxID=3346726 RepID=UPI00368339F6